MTNQKQNESGVLKFENDSIHFNLPNGEGWKLLLDDTKIIGEYTNSDGPHLDDYFFVFVRPDGSWKQASFYADGRQEFLATLSERLGQQIECGLCHSTTLNSRVLWPKPLAGAKLFTFAKTAKPKGFIAGILHNIGPEFLFEFDEPIKNFLGL